MDSRTASLVERARPEEKAILARVVSTLPLKGESVWVGKQLLDVFTLIRWPPLIPFSCRE